MQFEPAPYIDRETANAQQVLALLGASGVNIPTMLSDSVPFRLYSGGHDKKLFCWNPEVLIWQMDRAYEADMGGNSGIQRSYWDSTFVSSLIL